MARRRQRAHGRIGLALAVFLLATSCYTAFDFDNDNKADLLYTFNDAGDWFTLAPTGGSMILHTAATNVQAVPGDYDGNGTWEVATVAGDTWVSQSAGTQIFASPSNAGAPPSNYVLAVPADYDGDHTTDPAWFRDMDATWFIQGQAPIQFGATATDPLAKGMASYDQDFPVPADYDGDGKADLATYNPRTNAWKVRSSRDLAVSTVVIGGPNVYPAPGDYNGDGRAERAVFGWKGSWQIAGRAPVNVGPGDPYLLAPAIADFDGDGKADLSFVEWQQSEGTPTPWHIHNSASATITDLSLPSAALRRPLPVMLDYNLIIHTARFMNIGRCLLYPNVC